MPTTIIPTNFTTNLPNTTFPVLTTSKFPASFYIKVIVLLFLIICGTLGNVLIIATVKSVKRLNIPGNRFIINLAGTDILITGVCLPIILVNVIQDEVNLGTILNHEDDTFCEIVAYLKTIALHVSWYNLALIAVNRYYSVCRPVRYMYHFNKGNINKVILMVWVWVTLVNLPLIIGWAIPSPPSTDTNNTVAHDNNLHPPVVYDKSSHDCVLGTSERRGYTFASGIYIITLPIGAIICSYSMTILEIIRNTKKMAANMQEKQLKRRYKNEKKIFFMMLSVVLAFAICWLPALVYEFFPKEEDQTGTNYTQLVVNWLALSNSAMNAFFYGFLNKSFRVGYKSIGISFLLLMTKMCCWCKCSCNKHLQRRLKRNRVMDLTNSSTMKISTSHRNMLVNEERETNVFSVEGS